MLGIPSKKLHRWYKKVLSGFETVQVQQELHKHDLKLRDEKGKEQQIRVPILEEKNIGEHMGIDEKHIAGEYFTILMNRQTGKIALMANTLKTRYLYQIGSRIIEKCFEVKSLTRDLANNYDWLGRQLFMNAEQVGDKFHVLIHALDALQSIRIRFRQEELSRQRLAGAAHKEAERDKKRQLKKQGIPYRCQAYREELLSNGESHAQLLARSRYLLFKQKSTWSQAQAQRAGILFAHYPQIKQAYDLICKFRNWYDRDQIGKPQIQKKEQLNRWYKTVKKSGLAEVQNYADLVTRNEGVILNYFKNGFTNAHSEALNAKIQRLLHKGCGTRNLDFFLFRLKILFA